MRYTDIKVGEVYIYDKGNKSEQMETAINLVVVADLPSSGILFRRSKPIICYPILMADGSVDKAFRMEVYPVMLTPIDPDIRRNILIRYPVDMPVFNDADVVAIEVLRDLLEHADATLSSPLTMAKIKTLEEKVKFYAEKAKNTNNGIPRINLGGEEVK